MPLDWPHKKKKGLDALADHARQSKQRFWIHAFLHSVPDAILAPINSAAVLARVSHLPGYTGPVGGGPLTCLMKACGRWPRLSLAAVTIGLVRRLLAREIDPK